MELKTTANPQMRALRVGVAFRGTHWDEYTIAVPLITAGLGV
jgi:hypothetical protein